jgi:pimeloyl-ACP methyl ester carboxylesterase
MNPNFNRTTKKLAGHLFLLLACMPVVYGQLNYEHKTEIVFDNENSFELSDTIEKVAQSFNKHLNDSKFFDTTFLVQTQKVRAEHLNSKNALNKGTLIDVMTEDNITLGTTFFDRGSKKVLFVGEGFNNEREKMSPFLAMFPDYDIVLFDFRGQGYRDNAWKFSFAEQAFGLNSKLIEFGHKEHKDVFAVVDYYKHKKNYTNVFGLGVCYGAFILMKSQAMREHENLKLFDKLIVDGCWSTLHNVIDKIKDDPKLIDSPQKGGWSSPWFKKPFVRSTLEWLATNVMGLNFATDIAITPFLPDVKIPLLFFYGKDDLMITRDEFEQLWKNVGSTQKTAVITSNPHVINHIKQKELYQVISNHFFTFSHDRFMRDLKNPQALADYFFQEEQNKLNKKFADALAQENSIQVDELIHDGANVNAQNDLNQTPLHQAVVNNSPEIAQLLMNAGANANVLDNQLMTPLHSAVAHGNAEIAQILVAPRAAAQAVPTNVNYANPLGQTPTHLAANQENVAITQILINAGANTNITNNDGDTPLHIAAARGNAAMVAVLWPHADYKNRTQYYLTKVKPKAARITTWIGQHKAPMIAGFASVAAGLSFGYSMFARYKKSLSL